MFYHSETHKKHPQLLHVQGDVVILSVSSQQIISSSLGVFLIEKSLQGLSAWVGFFSKTTTTAKWTCFHKSSAEACYDGLILLIVNLNILSLEIQNHITLLMWQHKF